MKVTDTQVKKVAAVLNSFGWGCDDLYVTTDDECLECTSCGRVVEIHADTEDYKFCPMCTGKLEIREELKKYGELLIALKAAFETTSTEPSPPTVIERIADIQEAHNSSLLKSIQCD
jgi:predicted RNA-binding Zn-ribbon protein involved in translation (DUF1610 family)